MPHPGLLPSVSSLVLAVLLVQGAGAAPAPDAATDTVAVARIGAPQALLAVTGGRAVMVDVRVPAQRALGHIAGDLAIRYDQVARERDRLPAEKQIIFYCSCTHEEEALEAARAMPRPDDPRIAVLVGGIDAWRHAGGAVTEAATWEEVFRVSDAPRGWGKTPTEHDRCRYGRDSTVAASGRASGCVVCAAPESTATSLPGFSQRLEVASLRGRTVTLTARVRTEALAGEEMLWLAAETEDGKLLSFARDDANSAGGTTPWRPVSLRLTLPDETTWLDLGLQVLGGGKVWLDDVTLVAEPGSGRPRESIAVANPGFEE